MQSELQESKRTVESMRRSKTAIEKQKQTVDKKCATLEVYVEHTEYECCVYANKHAVECQSVVCVFVCVLCVCDRENGCHFRSAKFNVLFHVCE